MREGDIIETSMAYKYIKKVMKYLLLLSVTEFIKSSFKLFFK